MDGENHIDPSSTVGRKKRKRLVLQGESSYSRSNKENNMHKPDSSLCINVNQVRGLEEHPFVMFQIHHNIERQIHRRKVFHVHDRINLFNCFTNTVPNQTNNVPLYPSKIHDGSTPYFNLDSLVATSPTDVQTHSTILNDTHFFDEEDVNSDDGHSLADSYGSYDSLEADDVMDSHLQGRYIDITLYASY
ncbi:hypothetical protein RYX36_006864 [Vicia faba]